jgi:hypothetical protein
MGISAGLNLGGARPGVCTSSTRPATPYEGMMIYETDTDYVQVWNGSAWKLVSATTPYSGEPLKTFTYQANLTQKIYAATNDTIYNISSYTTNSRGTSYLLVTFGVAYEYNTSSDVITFAVNFNGVEQFSFGDSTNTTTWNEFPYYTFRSIDQYAASSTISNIRVYAKAASGQVVCPRSVGGPVNFSITIQEFAV